MDVTRDNFGAALSEFRKAVVACDFAAIDMEMTGLYESKEWQPHRQDSKDDRYAKIKRSVESYGVVQVGICLFTWIASSEGQGHEQQCRQTDKSEEEEESSSGYYEARPFNFNVFPCTSVGRKPIETHFGCKNTAFEFLSKNSFDFNKWVYSGIPYLCTEEAMLIKAERIGLYTNRQTMTVADDRVSRAFVKGFECALKEFISSGERIMRYDTANTYQRKIIHDLVSKHDALGTKGQNGCIEVFKSTKKAMAKHTAQRLKLLEASIEESRGFCTIIDLLSEARKPVVGHNMPLDVLHAYSKFYKSLPDTRVDFEQAVSKFLPVLIDTKYIIESTPGIKARYKTSNLDEIAPMLEKEASSGSAQPMIRNHPRFLRHVSNTMHEAGFDAYMTGATFIRLLNLDGGLDLSTAAGTSCEHGSELVLYRYINKLYLALGDELYWQVGGGSDLKNTSTSTASPAVNAVQNSDDDDMAISENDELNSSSLLDTVALQS
ncbi:hypothetical protein GGI25_005531 [Coemansia spiralis]|uniref:Uncharacterized protein n=2 Tax=Coemansia TaxID=4863 RepID=A0A9W8G3Z6_9FUNG|nr:hypothetical protein EDC05_004645 [Coemansia umbellata]KAJ2671372.1 hypothetical protein GGI25_005531 [Coemansia spiralis]